MSDTPRTNLPEWTVTELSGALKRTLEETYDHVRVRGEVGKVTVHGSGHVYIDIKDDRAMIAGVIWRGNAGRLRFRPETGMEVVATGKISTFAGQSKYQLIIDTLEPAGVGALLAQLEERKRRLAAEGLFAEERKQLLPFLPNVIGVVTSPTGAVIRDILHRLADRFPRHVLLWPVRVQGETCAAEAAAAIRGFNALPEDGPIPRPDLIIVARGGGSIEDLWGFNDEMLVRTAAESLVPLISAVGHETDWTLIDYVADRRAPTPTGAAEMAVPVRSELLMRVADDSRRLSGGLLRLLDARRTELRSAVRALPGAEDLLASPRQRLDLAAAKLGHGLGRNAQIHARRLAEAARRLARLSPEARLAGLSAKVDGLAKRLGAAREANLRAERRTVVESLQRVVDLAARRDRAIRSAVERRAERLAALAQLAASYGHEAVLARGFALVLDPEGRPIRNASAIAPGVRYDVRFADGHAAMTAADAPPPRPSGSKPAGGTRGQGSLFG
jgi:exodeoxyribonuclease VII large subunit